MATRIKKQGTVPKEVAASQTTNTKSDTPAESNPKVNAGKVQNGPGLPKKLGRPRKIVSKTVQLKAKAKTRGRALKINPKNFARVLLENGKGLEAKKIILKNGLKEVKRGRKPKAIKKIKEEPPPILEPISAQEDDGEIKKTPRKRGKKPQNKDPDLSTIKNIKTEIKEEPVDDVLDSIEELAMPLSNEASSPKATGKKPGRQRKIKVEDSIEEVMNDLSFLIKTEEMKKETVNPVLESSKNESLKLKKLPRRQRFDMLKRDLTKKENIENTLSKLDPADTTIIDRLDLNVRRVKSEAPVAKRRHSIEKFSVTSVDSSTESLMPQLSVFNQLPRCISPRTSKRNLKLGLRRTSPYTTRSDSPARILRNGKHRKLKDLALLEGLEDVKRRRRLHSELSGSESTSKLSGYDSDSSFSDLASLHGSEKDSELLKSNKENDCLLIEESSNLEIKPHSDVDVTNAALSSEPEKHLIDTNSNVYNDLSEPVDINLNAKTVEKPCVVEDFSMEETPSLKVPEKGLLLDIMKQTFNEIIVDKEKNQAIPKCEVSKFYGAGNASSSNQAIPLQEKKIESVASKEKLKIIETCNDKLQRDHNELLSEEQALQRILEETAPEVLNRNLNRNNVNIPGSEDFCTEDKEAEEQASFENIVQGCIDSIGNISPDLSQLTKEDGDISDEIPILEKEIEKDDSLPIIDNMLVDPIYPPNSESPENLEPPHLESSIPEPTIITKNLTNQNRSSNNDRNLGIAVTETDNVVSFSIEHLTDDMEEHDQSNEGTNQSLEETQSKIDEEEVENVINAEAMITDHIEEVKNTLEQENVECVQKPIEENTDDKIGDSDKVDVFTNETMDIDNNVEIGEGKKQEERVEMTEMKCDKSVDDIESEIKETANLNKIIVEESPEELAQKESILKALGLQSLRAAKEAKHQTTKDKPSTSKGDNYTGTLKTVIKINKKKGKNSFKMTLQKNKNKSDLEQAIGEDGYKIMKEGSSSSWKHSKDSSDTAGAHRKSHYSNRSNPDGSSEHTSDGEQSGTSHEKNGPEKALVIPEKASSFSIHPGRLCKDECSYCFGKFGLFDTPCHIAQMKSVERQNKILSSEKHLTRDSCLCDACYRHVDRKSNSPSYINKSLKRNSLVAPGPRQNHCHVLGCNNVSTNILRRKWIIKMRKSICQAINIDLDNPGLHSIPICDEHFTALEHLMVCAMCKRRLARNHIHYLGPEVKELNDALKDEDIPLNLSDKPVVCKLCKCFASIILKDPEERAENSVNFFVEYKKRLLHFNDIVPMDAAAAEEPIVVPSKNERSAEKKEIEREFGKRKRRIRNSSNETVNSGKDGQDEKDEKNTDDTEERDRVPSSETNNQNVYQSRSQSPEDGDEYSSVDYTTLIPAIALECPSDNESKKDYSRKIVGVQKKIPRIESLSNAVEISRTQKIKSDLNRSNDLAAQKLGQNPSISLRPNYSSVENDLGSWDKPPANLISNPAISVRQLFPGEEDLALTGQIDFKNVIERTPEGWEKCVATIQYDEETKQLWQELQKPYGNKSSFLRHLILLEKYFRNGDLVLSSTASHHAINYRESVHNRLRAYDNIPSSAGNLQPISMIPFNKMHKSSSGILTSIGQSGSNGVPPVTISQISRETESKNSSKAPITLQQLNQPPLLPTSVALQNLTTKAKTTGSPPGLISLHPGTSRPVAPIMRNQPQSQKIKFPITKNWRPNLIPIDPSKKNERKPGLVQVVSGGNPYHITLEDYKKMCAIKRSFEAKQKKLQEQQLLIKQSQANQSQQSVLVTHNSVLKSVVPKKGLIISKTSGGTVTENKTINLVPTTILSTSTSSILTDSGETILEKLDKQVERLGQTQDVSKTTTSSEKKPSVQILPRIPKSLTVIPQTIRKSSRPPSPVLYITPKNGGSNNNGNKS